MSPIGAIADSLVKRVDPEGRRHRARASALWAGVAGPEVRNHTMGFAFSEGELVVFVDSSAWAQELSLMEEEYRRRLNEDMEKKPVRSIRFSVSKRVEESRRTGCETAAGRGPRPPESVEPAPLDETEKRRVDRAVAGIGDPSLRESASRILEEDLGLRKTRRHAPGDTPETGPLSRENGKA